MPTFTTSKITVLLCYMKYDSVIG